MNMHASMTLILVRRGLRGNHWILYWEAIFGENALTTWPVLLLVGGVLARLSMPVVPPVTLSAAPGSILRLAVHSEPTAGRSASEEIVL